jgi:hypothetical protein
MERSSGRETLANPLVQSGARRHGIAGIHGIHGIVESVSYRF